MLIKSYRTLRTTTALVMFVVLAGFDAHACPDVTNQTVQAELTKSLAEIEGPVTMVQGR